MTQSTDDARIELEAAEWARLMRDEASVPEDVRRRFARWVMLSPAHFRHFVENTAVYDVLQALRPQREGTVEEWVASVREAAAEEPPASHEPASAGRVPARRHSDGGRWWTASAGIGLAAALIFGAIHWQGSNAPQAPVWHEYAATSLGPIVLEDGSTVELGPGAMLATSFSRNERAARQSAGDIYFEVQSEPTRPFRLTTPTAAIEVMGTKLSVGADAQITEIEVFEGRVRVSNPARTQTLELHAAEKTRVTAEGTIEPPVHVFKNARLAVVAEAYNARGVRPKLVVRGKACELTIVAELDLDDPQTLIRDLRGTTEYKIDVTPDVVTLRRNDDDADAKECAR